jgi:hypothetical protein
MRGANFFPLVQLADTFMNTQYGGRQRPLFKVVDFVALGAAEQHPQLEQAKNADMNGDDIPY